ncbi:hypothetical protein HYC85_020836 [Camellia sinensis]|uniref:Pentatricopeptide repeat-containing protein n=1 Tax=Camellia sinensis TaxID=4442 RepID=A0A7J7GUS7_CAMSI|nr:hypothetical protein HYC85_020836 [Camellia sinensis]
MQCLAETKAFPWPHKPNESLPISHASTHSGKSAIEHALSNTGVELSVHTVAKVVNRGNLGGEAMVIIWDEMQKNGHSSDMEVYEYVISGLCNVGQLENAVLVMEESLRKGTIARDHQKIPDWRLRSWDRRDGCLLAKTTPSRPSLRKRQQRPYIHVIRCIYETLFSVCHEMLLFGCRQATDDRRAYITSGRVEENKPSVQ